MSEAPKFEDIIYEVRDRAAWIIINRPNVYNAFRGRTLEELIKAFHLAANDRNVASIVLTGAGEKAFCTGGDQSAHQGQYDGRGVIGLPGSSPVNFTANFPLPIGTDWNAFLASPLNVTLDFPSIFLANAPQFFHPEIFHEGILSGNISLSGKLQHPRIDGEAGLWSGTLSGGGRTSFGSGSF